MNAPLTLTLALIVCGTSCVPAITVPPASSVARTDRAARPVELCVLMQERSARPRFQGVAEFSTEPWEFGIASIAVKHPAGLLIIDPAFGESIAHELEQAGPLVMALLGTGRTKRPLTAVMNEAGLSPADVHFAAVTHVHWDHVGALGDLPNAKIFIARPELAWVSTFTRFFEGGAMPHHLRRAKSQLYAFDFNGPPIDGFEHSFDFFGDGSIVAVPLPGHTPGSTGLFVKSADVTYFFTGDSTWTSRGVELPAHKLLVAIDDDLDALSKTIGTLKAFSLNRPDVRVIPAHDAAALEQIPPCRNQGR